jgi:HlyD family secretion protein
MMLPTLRGPRLLLVAAVSALAATMGCKDETKPDAYGNVEASEVVVSAQTGGQLMLFTPAEGGILKSGTLVGMIDTLQLALQREQILAQQSGSSSRANEVTQQINVLEVQREIAGRSYERTRRLFDQQAATAQQLDQAERDYRVLGEQIKAAQAQRQSVGHDVASSGARVAQIQDQIRRSLIRNPVAGTVLATYTKTGEFVQPGQPLYKIANLDTVDLRAYVTEAQLADVRIGQAAQVTVDVGNKQRRVVPGTVSWIASTAEFTPTPIQTRDERTNLVYAIKIRLPNPNGILKIGMPADVELGPLPSDGQ